MVGLLFPGQGAQAVGMGKDFYDNSPKAKALFQKADEVLGFSLSELIFNGPIEELTKTVNSQPAIYVTSLAALEILKEENSNLAIKGACGLSLGEFSALAALGVFSFEEGLNLVKNRGQWMEEAANSTEGGMISLLGLPLEKCGEVALKAGIEVANINSPDQIVLSGKKEAIAGAVDIATSMGAKRAIVLNVGGAFHSSLMKTAEEKLIELLETIQFKTPQGYFLSNVTGQFESSPETIKENLGKQVTSSVQWVKTLTALHERGEKLFIELAPGRVLKGLARKTNRELTVENLETKTDIEKINQLLKQKEASHAS